MIIPANKNDWQREFCDKYAPEGPANLRGQLAEIARKLYEHSYDSNFDFCDGYIGFGILLLEDSSVGQRVIDDIKKQVPPGSYIASEIERTEVLRMIAREDRPTERDSQNQLKLESIGA